MGEIDVFFARIGDGVQIHLQPGPVRSGGCQRVQLLLPGGGAVDVRIDAPADRMRRRRTRRRMHPAEELLLDDMAFAVGRIRENPDGQKAVRQFFQREHAGFAVVGQCDRRFGDGFFLRLVVKVPVVGVNFRPIVL
ncbi:hypothetical protein SDC9_131224 [bioreactor metagenome]|uniref:Uncharacterized protein n=1 Tax=bioreactor metagenome TaxID=1076179 RepID=A0A645D5A6_9ZZZZ